MNDDRPSEADPRRRPTVPNPNEDGAPDEPEGLIGRVLGGYRITTLIGEGSMGEVYQGVAVEGGALVAIKLLGDAPLADPKNRVTLIKRFEREIATTKSLNHPNIVRLLHSGSLDGDLPYIVMEYLDGHDLRDVLDDQVRLSPARTATIGRQIALALAEAHDKGFVHRDLKPENVLLVELGGEPDFVKVVDFGIARLTDPEKEGWTRLTRAGTAIGTPRYMAPEQIADEPVTGRTDLYALGVMLYEMVSGVLPIVGETEMQTAMMQLKQRPSPLQIPGVEGELLKQWRKVIHRLLAKEPDERPDTALAVAEQLAVLAEVSRSASDVSARQSTAPLDKLDRSVPADAATVVVDSQRAETVRVPEGQAAAVVDHRVATQLVETPTAPTPGEDDRQATAIVDVGHAQRLAEARARQRRKDEGGVPWWLIAVGIIALAMIVISLVGP